MNQAQAKAKVAAFISDLGTDQVKANNAATKDYIKLIRRDLTQADQIHTARLKAKSRN